MRRQLSSLELRCALRELSNLVGLTVDKAYHFGGFEILIRLKGREGKGAIHISSGSFVVAGDIQVPEGTQPTSFAMLLRKHLSGARLVEVRQESYDRIARFAFSGPEGERELVVELFGSGNVLLTQDGVIVQPLTVRSWSGRTLKSREQYLPPPAPVDLKNLSEEMLASILRASKSDAVRTLASSLGLGGPFAEEACALAGVKRDAKASGLEANEVYLLNEAVAALVSRAESGPVSPRVIVEDGAVSDFSAFELTIHSGMSVRAVATLGDAVREFYASHPRTAGDGQAEAAKEREETSARTVDQQRKAIARLESEATQQETLAESVYVNYGRYAEMIEKVRNVDLEDVPSIVPGARIVDAKAHLYSLPSPDGGEVVFQKGKDINQNAGRLYEQAKRSRERLEGARRALEETLSKGPGDEAEQNAPKPSARRIFWFERFRWFVTSEGNLAVAGKDAKTNEQVVNKHLKDRDLYAHAEVHGAPSVVLKAEAPDGSPKELGEPSKREACEFSLAFSKLWNAGLATGASYWVATDQVSKTPEPGEYLPKGAFVIRGKRNYARDIRVRCAIGAYILGDSLLAMCGPEAAVSVNCGKYVVLDPGRLKKTDLAKALSRALGLPLDDVMQVLPPGNCAVVSSKGVELPAGART